MVMGMSFAINFHKNKPTRIMGLLFTLPVKRESSLGL